jgi:hypothetical protein
MVIVHLKSLELSLAKDFKAEMAVLHKEEIPS